MMICHDMLKWIAAQSEISQARVERWCAINSHATNLVGLAKLSCDVADAFGSLGLVESIALPPAEQVDDAGQFVEQPLAPALSLRLRPAAPVQVLLVIHLDTVYLPQPAGTEPQKLQYFEREISGGGGRGLPMIKVAWRSCSLLWRLLNKPTPLRTSACA
jgi:hypothetical protein